MKIQLKQYHKNDQKQVKDFILTTWKEFGFTYMSEFDSDLNDPEEAYVKPGGMFYLLKDKDKIIGTIGIINKGNLFAEIKRFYIGIDYRGKGYGSQLYEKVIEFCRKKGVKKIEIETGKDFIQGYDFYKKRGFQKIKEDNESYYMEKFL